MELRSQIQALPQLYGDIGQIQNKLENFELVGKQSKLYNQILDTGRDYLEQARPEHCPLCKQAIDNLDSLLEVLRRETPSDVEKLRQEYSALKATLVQKQSRASQLEQMQKQLEGLESDLTKLPDNLEHQIGEKRQESERITSEITTLQAEIAQIEGRIKLNAEHRNRLQLVLRDIEKVLGRSVDKDVVGALDQAIQVTREKIAAIQMFDFQSVADKVDRARRLDEIQRDENQLRVQLDMVLAEVRKALKELPGEDIAGALDQAIQETRKQVAEIHAFDLQPIADKLDRAKQLDVIQKDEAQLKRQLDIVLEQVKQVMGRLPDMDIAAVLDKAIQSCHKQVAEIRALDLQSIAQQVSRAKQIDEIQKDEARLRQFESGYQTITHEKTRLSYQIQRLTNLRNALHDIAETTKRHQEAIVTGLLNSLDIHGYYQQLDPHPAYRQLQIEPELTKQGTYNYWIKALTDDRSHGTYVQTRFSTAQANCAAIAIFLAVNQHLSKQLETIILDDPSQSLDPDHKMRLAQTLAGSPRQVIVATEDPQMFEILTNAFGKPTVHQLRAWTIGGASLAA